MIRQGMASSGVNAERRLCGEGLASILRASAEQIPLRGGQRRTIAFFLPDGPRCVGMKLRCGVGESFEENIKPKKTEQVGMCRNGRGQLGKAR